VNLPQRVPGDPCDNTTIIILILVIMVIALGELVQKAEARLITIFL
jgi:heme A synthase